MKQNQKMKGVKKKNSWDYFNDWVIFLFVTLLPTQFGKHFFFPFSYISGVRVDYLSPTLYVTDILALILIVLNIKVILKTLYSKFYLPFRSPLNRGTKEGILLFCILVINILFSLSPPISLYWLLKIVELCGIAIIFAKKHVDEKKLLAGFLIGAAFTFGLSLMQYINKHTLQGIFYYFGERALSLSTPGVAKASLAGTEFLRPYATFSHPNSMSGFYLLLYFFVLAYKPFSRFFLTKHTLLLLSALLIFFSFSKIAILTFLLLNTVYFLKQYTLRGCRLCAIARILTLFAVSLIFVQANTDPLTIQKRLELLRNALDIIIRFPIIGTGMGAYLVAQKDFVSRFPLFFNQPVHNIFLLYVAQLGIIGGGIIGILAVKNKTRKIKQYTYVFCAVIITGLFDHYWLTLQQNMIFLAVVGGVLKLF